MSADDLPDDSAAIGEGCGIGSSANSDRGIDDKMDNAKEAIVNKALLFQWTVGCLFNRERLEIFIVWIIIR